MNRVIHRYHQIGNHHFFKRAQMFKARGLQGKPVQRGIAIVGGGLTGAADAPELLCFSIGLAVVGKGVLHLSVAVG